MQYLEKILKTIRWDDSIPHQNIYRRRKSFEFHLYLNRRRDVFVLWGGYPTLQPECRISQGSKKWIQKQHRVRGSLIKFNNLRIKRSVIILRAPWLGSCLLLRDSYIFIMYLGVSDKASEQIPRILWQANIAQSACAYALAKQNPVKDFKLLNFFFFFFNKKI